MTTRRTFTADQCAAILRTLAGPDGEDVDLGGGLRAVQMATKGGLTFKIEKDGKGETLLRDVDAATIAAISEALWEKGKEFLPDDAESSTTHQGWEERDGRFVCKDTACGRLCVRKDIAPALADDLESLLTPGELLRDKPKPENLDDLLTPSELRERPDPLAGTVEGLIPDAMR